MDNQDGGEVDEGQDVGGTKDTSVQRNRPQPRRVHQQERIQAIHEKNALMVYVQYHLNTLKLSSRPQWHSLKATSAT